ncbi:MAG: hypothetical protein ORN58_04790 [Sediminibacterium sp.]|nr:hypothetical protein [Sediminibacterium sp.]
MKTNEKQFDAVKYMRQQREKLSDKLSKMSKSEIVEYFRNRKIVSQVKPCA